MGLVTDILRKARERDKRIGKARDAVAALTFEEKGLFVAEVLSELRAGPPKPARRPRKQRAGVEAPTPKPKTTRDLVTEVLAAHAPLNVAGIHAAIERTSPGAIPKPTVAAAVSDMLGKGLLVRKRGDGRAMSVALANGDAGGTH